MSVILIVSDEDTNMPNFYSPNPHKCTYTYYYYIT